MIHSALEFVRNQLNQFLQTQTEFQSREDRLVFPAGNAMSPPSYEEGKITMVVLKMDQDSFPTPAGLQTQAQLVSQRPPAVIQLMVGLVAQLPNYEESLKYLTAIMSYFRENDVFNPANNPAFPDSVEAIHLNQARISLAEEFAAWQGRAKGNIPSIVYKIRIIGAEPPTIAPPVQ